EILDRLKDLEQGGSGRPAPKPQAASDRPDAYPSSRPAPAPRRAAPELEPSAPRFTPPAAAAGPPQAEASAREGGSDSVAVLARVEAPAPPGDFRQAWRNVLDKIHVQKPLLSTALDAAQPVWREGVLELGFAKPFWLDSARRNQPFLESLVSEE